MKQCIMIDGVEIVQIKKAKLSNLAGTRAGL